MRGMTATYVLVALLGLGLLAVAAGVAVFGDDRDEKLRSFVLSPMGAWSGFVLVPLYLLLVAYAVRQLLRPRPRRAETAADETAPPS
jgi:hypothetical protein